MLCMAVPLVPQVDGQLAYTSWLVVLLPDIGPGAKNRA